VGSAVCSAVYEKLMAGSHVEAASAEAVAAFHARLCNLFWLSYLT
jgi:hypothetical protein